MDDIAVALRRERAVSALLPLFFVSGGTALIYQTLWNRELHLVFGTSTFAIATVLAAFMCGLAIGGALMARYADSTPRPLRMYGILEVVIGLYALVFPFVVRFLEPVYLEAWRNLEPPPVLFGLIQFGLVGVALLLPTACMGATLPLLARFATDRMGAAGDRVGTLYAVNTAGAVFGTWLSGFVLLPWYGLWATTLMAALANLVLGAVAIGLDTWSATAGKQVEVRDDVASKVHPMLVPVAATMALAGFASLVYEVAWTRLMGLMLGASVYAFSVMLLAFLVGIAIGGKLGGPIADRVLRSAGQAGVLKTLAAIEIGVAVLSYLLMYVYPELPFWYVWMFDFMVEGATEIDTETQAMQASTAVWAVSLLLSGAVMTPPAVLMGAAFPVSVRAVLGGSEELGGPVGQIYAANTAGGVLGAFLAGFVLLPNANVQGTIFVAALANLTAAGIVLYQASKLEQSKAWALGPVLMGVVALAYGVQRPPWDPMLMTAGMYHYVSAFEDHSREGIESYAIGMYELVYYEEGLSTVVTVAENRNSGNIWLANNGKVDASTTTDMPTQILCSLLPMQFVDSREDVLVIGLASGITAGAVTLLDDLGTMDVVELEPAILDAARFFHEYNHGVMDNEKVNHITNDGRNHLLLTPPGTYDVIVSEPSNPWITGVSNLFTREFWEMGKQRLKPGGVWSQWVQMYSMDDDDLRSLLRTFAEVFPHVIVFATIEDADLVLVGSDEPLDLSPEGAARLFEHPRVRKELAVVDITDPMQLVALYQMDRERILEVAGNAPQNTDDNMRIEYRAPKNLHRDTHDENFRLLLESSEVPESLATPEQWVHLARVYRRSEDTVRAVTALARAVQVSDPNDPRRERWLRLAERLHRKTAQGEVDEAAPEQAVDSGTPD